MNHADLVPGVCRLAVAAFALWRNATRQVAEYGERFRVGRRARRLGQWLLLPGMLLLAVSAGLLLARHGLVMLNFPWHVTTISIFVLQSGWAMTVTRSQVQRMRRLLTDRCLGEPPAPGIERALHTPQPRWR